MLSEINNYKGLVDFAIYVPVNSTCVKNFFLIEYFPENYYEQYYKRNDDEYDDDAKFRLRQFVFFVANVILSNKKF